MRGTLRVTVADTDGRLVVEGTLVKGLDTVALAVTGEGRWMTIISRRASPAGRNLRMATLRSCLPSRSCSSWVSLTQASRESWDLVLLEVHDGVEDTEDGVEDEHVEGTLKGLAVGAVSLEVHFLSWG